MINEADDAVVKVTAGDREVADEAFVEEKEDVGMVGEVADEPFV